MKKKVKTIIIFTCLFLFFILLIFNCSFKSSQPEIKIGKTKIFVEIANTPEKREKGLSGRDFLPENQGMLFVFEKPDFYHFWMKEMKFPLDFIWIFEDKVVDITEKVKPEDFQPPKSFGPKEMVDKVLEVNAGFVKKNNIKIGDKVKIDL